MRFTVNWPGVSAAAMALFVSGLAHASMITSVTGPVGGSGTVSGNLAGNNLTITEGISAFSPIDGFAIVLNVVSPPFAASVYSVTKAITNNTGDTWNSYFVGVGCDTSSSSPTAPRGSVDCYSSGLSSRLNAIPAITSTAGGAISQTSNAAFQVTGLNVLPGETLTLTFNLDTCPTCSGGQVMFQHANLTLTPEPGSFLMLGSALIALPLWLRRRQR